MSSRPSRGAARLAAILDALPDALVLVNANGTVVNANAMALEMLEAHGTALVGRGLLDLLPEFDSRLIPGSMRRPDTTDERGRTKPTRMVARRTDGGEFPVEVTSANLERGQQSRDGYGYYDAPGYGSGDELLMLVVRDLSGTVDTEAELARSQRQTEMILRAAAEGVVGTDTDGRVVLVNPAAAQILGYRASDLGGKELHTLVLHSRADGAPFPYAESPLADTLRSGRKHRVRGQVLWSKKGEKVPVDLTTAPVRDGDQLVGAVMTFTDRRPYDALATQKEEDATRHREELERLRERHAAELTALREQHAAESANTREQHAAEFAEVVEAHEEELAAKEDRYAALAEREKDRYEVLDQRHEQLLAVLGGSLRGPLDELRRELSTLAADDAGQLWPEANQVLHHLAAGYARITTLVENVLSYQRLDAGTDRLYKRPALIDSVVTAGVDGAVELIGPGRAQFAVHAPPVEAEVDPERLATALAHLVADVAGVDATGNAPVASGGYMDSTIVVAAAQRGDVVRIEVRGPYAGGDLVHEPIVRGIVRAHGGVLQTHEVPGMSGSAYVLEVPIGGAAAGFGTVAASGAAGGTDGGRDGDGNSFGDSSTGGASSGGPSFEGPSFDEQSFGGPSFGDASFGGASSPESGGTEESGGNGGYQDGAAAAGFVAGADAGAGAGDGNGALDAAGQVSAAPAQDAAPEAAGHLPEQAPRGRRRARRSSVDSFLDAGDTGAEGAGTAGQAHDAGDGAQDTGATPVGEGAPGHDDSTAVTAPSTLTGVVPDAAAGTTGTATGAGAGQGAGFEDAGAGTGAPAPTGRRRGRRAAEAPSAGSPQTGALPPPSAGTGRRRGRPSPAEGSVTTAAEHATGSAALGETVPPQGVPAPTGRRARRNPGQPAQAALTAGQAHAGALPPGAPSAPGAQTGAPGARSADSGAAAGSGAFPSAGAPSGPGAPDGPPAVQVPPDGAIRFAPAVPAGPASPVGGWGEDGYGVPVAGAVPMTTAADEDGGDEAGEGSGAYGVGGIVGPQSAGAGAAGAVPPGVPGAPGASGAAGEAAGGRQGTGGRATGRQGAGSVPANVPAAHAGGTGHAAGADGAHPQAGVTQPAGRRGRRALAAAPDARPAPADAGAPRAMFALPPADADRSAHDTDTGGHAAALHDPAEDHTPLEPHPVDRAAGRRAAPARPGSGQSHAGAPSPAPSGVHPTDPRVDPRIAAAAPHSDAPPQGTGPAAPGYPVGHPAAAQAWPSTPAAPAGAPVPPAGAPAHAPAAQGPAADPNAPEPSGAPAHGDAAAHHGTPVGPPDLGPAVQAQNPSAPNPAPQHAPAQNAPAQSGPPAAGPAGRRRAPRALPAQAGPPDPDSTQGRAISVRTLGQGVPFGRRVAEEQPTGGRPVSAPDTPSVSRLPRVPSHQPPRQPAQPQQQTPPHATPVPGQTTGSGGTGQTVVPGRRRKLGTREGAEGENAGTAGPQAPQPGPGSHLVPARPGPAQPPPPAQQSAQSPAAPPPPVAHTRLASASEGAGRSYAIGAPDENAAEGPEPLDGPGGAVEVADQPVPVPLDDELPPEPLDNPRRLLVWPAPDVHTQQALSDRGYRPVIVHSREEVDSQIAAFPAALFVDPLTGPITKKALQSLRQAAVAAEVPVLVTAGLGQATREAAYGADPAVLLKALAPRDSEQHPPRVLLIEEHPEIAMALTATLERRGLQVACAASDADAVGLATRMRPNLVVMDLMQVRRRHAGIVDWLRANGQLNHTPLVVYTAAVDRAELPRLAAGETVLFLAERSTSAEVQGRIVDLLAKIGTN